MRRRRYPPPPVSPTSHDTGDPAVSPRADARVRGAYAATAVLAFSGVLLQLAVNIASDANGYGALWESRHLLSYFTITSNLLVGVIATLRAREPRRSGRWFDAIWLVSLVMISVTGMIYWTILAGDQLTGLDWAANVFTHTLTPLAAVGSWLLVGPRGRLHWGLLPLMLAIPVAWLAHALIRGALAGYYAYFFMDVSELGYVLAARNVLGVVLVAFVLASVYVGIDRLLSRSARHEERQAVRALTATRRLSTTLEDRTLPTVRSDHSTMGE